MPRLLKYRLVLLKLIVCIFGVVLLCGLGFILTQPFQLFPGAFFHRHLKAEPPPEFERMWITTADNQTLDTWRLAPTANYPSKKVALFFHGNGGDMYRFVAFQKFLAAEGYTAYSFDYRGFGQSTGFPSETGIYADTDAVWNFITEREQVTPETIVPVGFSLGTGPATHAAQKYHSHTLLLFAPYTSIPDVVRQRIGIRFLAPFVWYEFPTLEMFKTLRGVCVVIAHGEEDTIIRHEHGLTLARAGSEKNLVTFISNPTAQHNNILDATRDEVSKALRGCEKDGVTQKLAPPVLFDPLQKMLAGERDDRNGRDNSIRQTLP